MSVFYLSQAGLGSGSVKLFPYIQRETVAWIVLYALSGIAAYMLAGSDAFVGWLVIVTVSTVVLMVPNRFLKSRERTKSLND